MALYYRVCSFGKPQAPWRSSRKKAQQDAVALGLGEYDEWGKFYISVPGDIEWIHERELSRVA
jgi:hypothetical protein